MNAFFEFACEHPWLTFFGLCVLTSLPVRIIRAVRGASDVS